MKTRNPIRTFQNILIALLTILALAACQPAGSQVSNISTTGLRVWLDQPPDGARLPLAPFTLKAHARDEGGSGVIKIAFLVNSVAVGSLETDPSQPLVYAELPWNPSAPGSYQIQAQAFDSASSALSEVANVCVGDQCEVIGTQPPNETPDSAATQPPAETPQVTEATTQPPVEAAGVTPTAPCPLDSQYVADITIPDGTEFAPGAAFTKTWRIRNNGCSPWPDGTQLVFSGDEQMGGESSVPAMLLPVGNTQDFSVNLVAPGAPGSHSGYWQLHGPDGVAFGDRVFVRISVVVQQQGTEPPPEQTEPATQPPQADNTPPDISNIGAKPNPVFYGDSCGPNDPKSFTVSASVSDPSGLKSVRLFFQYVSSINSGSTGWDSVGMPGSGTRSATVTIDTNSIYKSLQGTNGYVEYYIMATDKADNQGSSQHFIDIGLLYCIG